MKEYKEMMNFELGSELYKELKMFEESKERVKEIKKTMKSNDIKYTKNIIKEYEGNIENSKLLINLFERNIKDYEKDLIDFKGLPTYIKQTENKLEKNKYNLIMEKRKIIMFKKELRGRKKWLKTLEEREYEIKTTQDNTTKY